MLKFMNVEEFIHEHLEVNNYKDYCEALVDKDGKIAYAIPSHDNALMALYGLSDEDIFDPDSETRKELIKRIPLSASPSSYMSEELQACLLWYSNILLPLKYTEEQLIVISKLIKEGILYNNSNIAVSTEYSHYQIIDNPVFNVQDLDVLYKSKIEAENTICYRLYELIHSL